MAERIRLWPLDPILKVRACDIGALNDEVWLQLSKMEQSLLESKGVGLSANQIGYNINVFVTNIPSEGIKFYINPKILELKGKKIEMREGCLSIPGFFTNIKRFPYVKLQALDIYNKSVIVEAEGLKAQVFQHETNHLSGKLLIDHLPRAEKGRLMGNILKNIGHYRSYKS